MFIIKRDEKLQEFNPEKISNAITKAYWEVMLEEGKISEEEEIEISNQVRSITNEVVEILDGIDEVYIEDVQDLIENIMMDYNKKVSKAFIRYRNKRAERRESIKQVYYKSEFLSEEFLSQYPDYPEHMSGISRFTFLRTYSRDIIELQRRETFKEMCIRSVHHNISMDTRVRTKKIMKWLRREAETLFDMQFNLRGFLSGRAMFTGGSKAAESYPLSLFNCSFIEPDSLQSFRDILYLLSVGAGVGYRNTWDVVEKLPRIIHKPEMVSAPYSPAPRHMRLEKTKVEDYGDVAAIIVGDSKEGWAEALYQYLKLMSDPNRELENITIFYNNVRPAGEPLMTFGGYASGHEPLQRMFEYMHEVLTGDYKDSKGNILTPAMIDGKWRPIHVMHIANLIASAIVVGGVRRAAMIALFSRDDEEMKLCKRSFTDFTDPKIAHYWLSNNTMIFEKGYTPTREELKIAIDAMQKYGEPGFMNETELTRRHPHARGANPCFEILLRSLQTCNLVTWVASAYILPDGTFDMIRFMSDLKVLTRAAYRVTLNKLELPHWNAAQEEDRLLGVSPTGWMDMIEALDLNNEEEAELLQVARQIVKVSADDYADHLGLNKSLNRTAVKPSGTLSLIANSSSPGVHMTHAPYYWRTIRVSKNNPIYPAIQKLNWRIEDEFTNPDVAVVYFPMKSDVKRTKFDTTVIEQFERYKRFQRNYTEQNTSITISVQEGEWKDVIDWLENNWDEFTGVSFLSLTKHEFKQAPYMDMTKEEYNKAIKGLDVLTHELITKYLDLEGYYKESADEQEACSGGACALDRL